MKPARPFVVSLRKTKSPSFSFTLNPPSGLPPSACEKWKRKSFRNFPYELRDYSMPKNKAEAEKSVIKLISFLKKEPVESVIRGKGGNNITVGEWVRLFTNIDGNPKALKKDIEGRPYSLGTVKNNQMWYKKIAKYTGFMNLKMNEVREADILGLLKLLSETKAKDGRDYKETRAF
jgi:hypothetical protein